jgi:putative endonuclease
MDGPARPAGAACPVGDAARVQRGRCNHAAGRKAEQAVRVAAEARGWTPVAERWRCAAGELDLVFRDGAEYVVIEVKSARDFDTALARITPRQAVRIYRAAEVFLGTTPEGGFARIRFDAGLVDRFGSVRIMENALLPC